MLAKRKRQIVYIVMVSVFAVTFSLGIFGNPNFNIHDFFMNMASELLGLVFTLVVVDVYIRMKEKDKGEAAEKTKAPDEDGEPS